MKESSEKEPLDVLARLSVIDDKYKGFFNLIFKPLITLLIFLSVGYYTMWLTTNYVSQDKFAQYVKQQIESDGKQDELAKNRFETTQTKLEVIISQQITFTEQFKFLNNQLSDTKKDIDAISERMTYLERRYFERQNSSNP